MNSIIDEAAEIMRQFSKGGPKNPHTIARLLSYCDESGLAVVEFARRVRCNAGAIYLWRKGLTGGQKPWPALAAALAQRSGAALASVMNAELSPSASAPTHTDLMVSPEAMPDQEPETLAERAAALMVEARGDQRKINWSNNPTLPKLVALFGESGMTDRAFLNMINVDRRSTLANAIGLHLPRKATPAAKPTTKPARKPPHSAKVPPKPNMNLDGVTFDGTELRIARSSPMFRAVLLAAFSLKE